VTGAVCLAGVLALLAGAILPVAGSSVRTGLLVQALGATLLGIVGGGVLWSGDRIGARFSGGLQPAFGVDRLSGVFLLMLGLVTGPVLVFAAGYLDASARSRAVAALTGVFVLMLVALLCARDVVMFLLAWELMTLIPAAIILVSRSDETARRSVFVYAAVTHLAGAGVWIALLLLADHGALGGHALDASSGSGALVAVAALIGFGAKAGVMPLHVWLPRAHPIAPAHISALMSGVMIKIALYGLMRVLFQWLDRPPLWLGAAVVVLGAVSALGGVVYALFQHELKRLLALHSIENVGIILLGLGAALILRREGDPGWAGVAFAAALLHTINHAVFKALLFLGAGAFDQAVRGLELDRLGGLLRRMPWTGFAFLIGAAAIAGLPPLNGFVSEWLTLQALFHLALTRSVTAGAIGAVALAGLAVTAALAVYCFVKVVGLVLLGPPRRHACQDAVEASWSMRCGMIVLAGWCVALGAVPGALTTRFASILPGSAHVGNAFRVNPPGTGGIPTVALAATVVVLVGALRLARGRRVADSAPTWACGQRVEPALNWTSAGFTKPVRLVLEGLLRPEREISVRVEGGIVQSVSYRGRVPLLIEERVYAPLAGAAVRGAAGVRRLQSGRLGVYVIYLTGLLVALLACARLGLLG
jgi:hydrogenase-4 component B